MSRKPDVDVGKPGGPAVGGGHQTAEQAAVTQMEGGGRTDEERKGDWGAAGREGRPPVAIGGNSQGQGDRQPTGGATVSNGPSSNPATVPGNKHES